MKTKSKVGMVLLGLVIVVVFGGTVFAVRAYRAPLGAALDQNTPTTIPARDQVVSTAVPTLAQADVCGETGTWNVLVLGSDAADLNSPKGSDLTRVIRVDFPNKKVTIYAFPRDLWVDTAGLGLTNPNIDAAPLGAVFYEARSRSTSTDVNAAMRDGTNVTARMLAKNFLISTDHYVTLDLSQVPNMVDTVGGIPINIPAAVTDPWIGMTIPAGQQTLSGKQFVAYARAMPDSDFNRIQRNDLLMDALRDKLLDPGILTQIPQLYGQFSQVIATDLSPEQINHLACLLKEVPENAIIKDSVKPEWTSPGPVAGSLAWDKPSILNRLKELEITP